MEHTKTIKINTILPATAQRKADAVQALVNIMDEDNLEFMAKLCATKPQTINQSLRANAELIKNNL